MTLKRFLIKWPLVLLLGVTEFAWKSEITSVAITIFLLGIATASYVLRAKLYGLRRVIQLYGKTGYLWVLFAYLILGTISTLWAEYPLRSIYYSVTTILYLTLYSVYLFYDNPNRSELQERITSFVVAIVFVEVFISLLSSGGQALIHNLHGVAGFEAAVALALLLFNGLNDHKKKALFAVILFILIITTSMKAISAFAIFTVFYKFFLAKGYKRFLLFVILLILVTLLFIFDWSALLSADLGKIQHLSGRTTIWYLLFSKYQHGSLFEQIVGFGFASGDVFFIQNQKFYNAHHFLISGLLGLGIVGFFMQITIMFGVFRSTFKAGNKNSKSRAFMISGSVMIYINGFANQSLGGYLSGPYVSSFALLVLLAAYQDSRRDADSITS